MRDIRDLTTLTDEVISVSNLDFLNYRKNDSVDMCRNLHCVKCVQIRSFFWSVFSSVNLRIQSEYRKILTRKSPYLDIFHAVLSR